MPRKSTVDAISAEAREELDRMVRDNRATIDQIRQRLSELEGEDAPSRSAIGRYVQSAKQQMERYRQAQEVAKVWVGKLEEEPDGDVGRLLSEMLRTVAFSSLSQLGDEDAQAEAKDIRFLAQAIKDLASADKISAERELRIRKETAEKAAQKMEAAEKKGKPLTAAEFRKMMKDLYG